MSIFQGDSGGPSWVYHMGRAVIVGVNRGFLVEEVGKFRCGNETIGVYVPFYLDWILETIRIYDKLP